MKGIFAALIFVIAFGMAYTAFAKEPETLRVQVNHEKRLAKSKLTIRFVELVEDSRCPVDVQCIWAGNARIKIKVSKNGRSHELTLDTNGPNQVVNAEGYSIKFLGLTPEPRSNIRINRNGYVASLQVAKADPSAKEQKRSGLVDRREHQNPESKCRQSNAGQTKYSSPA